MLKAIFVSLAIILAGCGASSPEMPLPELAGGLPSNFEQAQKVFDQRVKAKFAVGTLESNLKAVVINQGFRLFPASSPSDFAMAVLERKESFLCLGR